MKKFVITISFFFCLISVGYGQFTTEGQYLLRPEFRNGYNKLIDQNDMPVTFIAHRFRIESKYQFDNIELYLSLQDIRTWGSTATTKLTDNYFSAYEAYVKINLNEHWKLKLGRQELNYDNVRFLGNLDWALQGRSHDFALAQYKKGNSKLDFGGGYNQNATTLAFEHYSVKGNFKTAQFARYENKFKNINYALFFWNNGLEQIKSDSAGNFIEKKIRFSPTLGLSKLEYKIKNTTLSAFYYYQGGRDIQNKRMEAFDANFQVSSILLQNKETGSKVIVTIGGETLSGTSNLDNNSLNRSFSPLYGTNHPHNGYMDLFYVGGAHENSVGLHDVYIRFKYEPKKNLFFSVNVHRFTAYADVYDVSTEAKLNKNLGKEIDVTFGYVISKSLSLQGGYSHFFAENTFVYLQNLNNANPTQNWAYLMLIVRPNSDKKFIGLLF
jgi:hypothetical protein